ncbi:hypothetical protein ACFL1P_00530, partial [Patescibacteria group bacterium]
MEENSFQDNQYTKPSITTNTIKLMAMQNWRQILVLLVLFAGLITGYILTQTRQELRKKASTSTGTATITFSPASNTSFPSGSQKTVEIFMNTGSEYIGGAQIFLEITGDIPSDLSFTHNPNITGVDDNGNTSALIKVTSILQNITNGKKLSLVYGSPTDAVEDPNNPPELYVPPYSTKNTHVSLGTFTFTPSSSGSVSFTYINDGITMPKIT